MGGCGRDINVASLSVPRAVQPLTCGSLDEPSYPPPPPSILARGRPGAWALRATTNRQITTTVHMNNRCGVLFRTYTYPAAYPEYPDVPAKRRFLNRAVP